MAIVAKLQVDSSQYDNSLKKAVETMTKMEQEVRRTGAVFKGAEKDDLEFIKSLGQLNTAATSSVGKLAEMKKAFTELSVVYQNMTKEEQRGDVGKALSQSLGQIKGNIGELSNQIGNAQGEIAKAGGFSNMLAESLGKLGPAGQMAGKLLKGAFGPVGIAIAAVVGVIQQLVAAFKRNESAMASAERAAAPFKAIWQQIQRLFDRMVPAIATGMEKIADIFKSVTERITGWLGKLGQTKLGQKLGLDDLYEKLKKVGEENKKLTESNEKIATKEQENREYTRKAESQNAKDQTKISDLRYKASDKDAYSSEERLGFTKEAMELEGKILQRNLAIKQKELELIKLKNSLIGTGTDGLNEQNDAVIAVEQAQQAYNQHMRSMERELLRIEKENQAEKRAQIEEDANEQIAALDQTTMSEQEYADTVYNIKKKMYEDIAQLYDEDSKEYAKAMSQKAQLDIQYQNGLMKQANKELAEQKKLDNKILSGLTGAAKKGGWSSSDLGLDGIKTKINAGVDITEEDWTAIQDKLNERLQSLGLEPIKINFETGNVEQVFDEIKTQMDALKESMSKMSSGVGAISTIGNAFNDLKGIGEDLTAAFSGEMDAWDSLMTVFNSGISIMQTVIGVMEAINTLQELSSALSKKKVVEQTAETATVVAGKGAEAAAETAEATASGAATAANTAEAAAGAGKAMAGIPIVGPVLAIAAIAAVLAAVLAATSKAKSAGNFAVGGLIPGNSYSGDNLTANVNSGELILNRSQQDSIASQLTGNSPMQNLQLSTEISGTNLRVVLNNDNRSKGGSRGYYANIH